MSTQPNPPQFNPPSNSNAENIYHNGSNNHHSSPEQPLIMETTGSVEEFEVVLSENYLTPKQDSPPSSRRPQITLMAIAIMIIGLFLDNFWVGISGAMVALLISLPVIWRAIEKEFIEALLPEQRSQLLATIAMLAAIAGLLKLFDIYPHISTWGKRIKWEAFGSMAEWTGALGQILIAILAVYIAWRQYIISKDLTIEQNRLTIQQNTLTQQQTIDAYFQGVSDLALDDEGLLEDWPQERAFAEGRTAAILGSVDAAGKAKVLRFLSKSNLLTPLKRDRRLGRAILNGEGGYEEERYEGVRVIDLNVMLAEADLAGTDLRWTDLSEANLVKANLTNCDLVKANLSRTILYEANLAGADIKGTRFFYGSLEMASPRSRSHPPNYETGAYTGTVVENVNFTGVKRMSVEQRHYCCSWCGEKSRSTIPGGCEGIPNLLGR